MPALRFGQHLEIIFEATTAARCFEDSGGQTMGEEFDASGSWKSI
jgi:hypothetical protein